MKDDRDWIPDATDLDWIESLRTPLAAGARRHRGRGRPARRPDRRSRHRPRAVGARRRPPADRRGRHGLRLLDAVDGPRPAGRRHDRHDRPGPRADRPRPRLVARGGHRRRADHGRHGQGARGVRGRRAGPGRAVRPGLHRRAQARVRGATSMRCSPAGWRRAPSSSPTTSCGAAASSGSRPAEPTTRTPTALRAFCERVLGRPAVHGDDPAARGRVARRHVARLTGREPDARPGPPVRDPARAGRARARSASSCADGADGRGRLGRARRALPGARARAATSVRFARNGAYAEPATTARRRRRGGDDPAGVGRRARRGAARPPRILELRETPFAAAILAELTDRLATPEDGAAVGFLGRTRSTPGTPAPGQEAEAARHAGRAVERSSTRPTSRWPLAVLGDDRRRDRGALRRRARGHRPSHRRGAAGRGRRSRSWRSRRTATRHSLPPATPSTRRRPARRSGRPSGSPTATSGSAIRRGPARGGACMRVYISVDMEGIGGISHPHPTDPKDTPLPDVGRADGRRDERRDRGRARGRRHRRPRQRQPLEHVQPAARRTSIRRRGSSRARRPGRWSPGRSRDPTAPGFDVALFVGYHARAGHPPRDDRPHLLRRAGRDAPRRPADRRVRAQRAASSARGASRSVWSPATTRWPRRSRPGCRGPSGSSSRSRTAATARSRPPDRRRERVRAGARACRPARGAAGELQLPHASARRSSSRSTTRAASVADHAAIVPGRGAGRRPDACASGPTIRSPRTAASSPINRLAGAVDGEPRRLSLAA